LKQCSSESRTLFSHFYSREILNNRATSGMSSIVA
jgi:hypothetical protein